MGPSSSSRTCRRKGRRTLTVYRPEIYYGTEMTSYQIVSTGVKEFDYPKGDQNVYTSYAGHGGVLLDNFWKKALFAWYQLDANIVLSSYLPPQSRIQFGERSSRVFPGAHLS